MRYFKAVAHRELFSMVDDDTSDVHIDEMILDKMFNDLDWSDHYMCVEISEEEYYSSMKGNHG